MPTLPEVVSRVATADDSPQLLGLWGLLFDEDDSAADEQPLRSHARRWLASVVSESSTARVPVIDVQGQIVATAVGTLELGVPNPHCPGGAWSGSRT